MEQYSSNALRQRAVEVTGGGKDEEGEFEGRATGDVRFVACPNKAFPRYSFQTQHASGRGITLAAWKRLSKPLICLNKSQYLTTRKKTYCHVNYGRWLYCTTKNSSTVTSSQAHIPRNLRLQFTLHLSLERRQHRPLRNSRQTVQKMPVKPCCACPIHFHLPSMLN